MQIEVILIARVKKSSRRGERIVQSLVPSCLIPRSMADLATLAFRSGLPPIPVVFCREH